MLNIFVMGVEWLKEVTIIHSVQYSSSLSDRMHTPHWCANINCLDTCVTGNNGTNSWTACWIVSHHKLLNRNISFLSHCFQKCRRNQICGISLVVVGLDDYTFVDLDWMVVLMFGSIVRMHCMGHICWNKVWILKSLLKAINRHLFPCCKELIYSVYSLKDYGWASALSWVWSTFFVVEQESHIDRSAFILNLSQGFKSWIEHNLQCQEEKRLSRRGELMKSSLIPTYELGLASAKYKSKSIMLFGEILSCSDTRLTSPELCLLKISPSWSNFSLSNFLNTTES